MDKTYLFVKNKLESFGYLPMWIILLIDLIIISITIVITNFLFLNIKLTPYDTLSFYELNGLIIGTNCFFFLLFKTYKGIIRYSSFVDGMKLLFATFSTLVALVSLNYWHYWVFDKKIFIIPGLLIGFVLSLSLLFSFRIFIKYVFEKLLYFDDANNNSKPAMILGSDANAIAVANAIKAENPLRFKVIGFVDKSKSSKSKSILGLPLFYTNKKMSVILRSLKASTLIIVEKALTENERLNIVDDCLENNIKVFTVPLVVNWESQFEISEKIKSFQIEDLLERQAIVIENSVISKQISFKTILITGAAGSIGSEIVRQVLQFKPKALILVDQAETPLHHLSLELEKLELKVDVFSVISDVRNKNGMEKIFKKYNPEIVFHAAAYKHVPLME
ncbi:polysaccharide biosynthesis protein, partial [uncultured Flavobacterium sp.]|uniref:polysaccharide biosynthesis protein n=1 Tax=uncultured Flavobacterium sp. TaxID=165435 RepID=UPI0030CA4003